MKNRQVNLQFHWGKPFLKSRVCSLNMRWYYHVCFTACLCSYSNSSIDNLGDNHFTLKRKRDFRMPFVAQKRFLISRSSNAFPIAQWQSIRISNRRTSAPVGSIRIFSEFERVITEWKMYMQYLKFHTSYDYLSTNPSSTLTSTWLVQLACQYGLSSPLVLGYPT